MLSPDAGKNSCNQSEMCLVVQWFTEPKVRQKKKSEKKKRENEAKDRILARKCQPGTGVLSFVSYAVGPIVCSSLQRRCFPLARVCMSAHSLWLYSLLPLSVSYYLSHTLSILLYIPYSHSQIFYNYFIDRSRSLMSCIMPYRLCVIYASRTQITAFFFRNKACLRETVEWNMGYKPVYGAHIQANRVRERDGSTGCTIPATTT